MKDVKTFSQASYHKAFSLCRLNFRLFSLTKVQEANILTFSENSLEALTKLFHEISCLIALPSYFDNEIFHHYQTNILKYIFFIKKFKPIHFHANFHARFSMWRKTLFRIFAEKLFPATPVHYYDRDQTIRSENSHGFHFQHCLLTTIRYRYYQSIFRWHTKKATFEPTICLSSPNIPQVYIVVFNKKTILNIAGVFMKNLWRTQVQRADIFMCCSHPHTREVHFRWATASLTFPPCFCCTV